MIKEGAICLQNVKIVVGLSIMENMFFLGKTTIILMDILFAHIVNIKTSTTATTIDVYVI